ncbi:quinon protein alcohol dehydrogenase-like superfamily [Trichoderma austrokoningii]
MEESRQFLGNTVGDYASIVQGNITVTNNVDADAATAAAAADEAFLRKFSKTNPIDNKNRILESKGRLLDDSYRWILEHQQYTKWRDTENSGVLWIKGDPGKGKTMLLCGIIKEFEKDSTMQERLAYFFCQGTDNKINTSTAIIRGLIYLFLRQHPKLLSIIQKEIKKEPGDFLEGDNEQFALCRIFKRVVKDACISYPVCIIDALDECQHEESLQSLFSLIVDTSSHVKWLLSSRNEKWIEQGLCAVEEHQRLTLELRGNSEHISDAVKTYIDHCIQGIHALKDDSELRHKTAELLHAKANGTFLWVTLVVKELHKTSHPHVEAVLQSMPEDLKELYDEIMRRAKKRWRADKHACLTILAIGFVEACGSFISNTNDTIYFIHQSVKDYMVHETNRKIFPSDDADQHFTILKRNEHPLGMKYQHVCEIMPPDLSPSTPMEYCCIFWVEHLVQGCKNQQSRLRECLKNNEEFRIFINKKCLYWLEIMIRLKSTSHALGALHKLHVLAKTCCAIESETAQGQANRILELTRDLSRVISQNRVIIDKIPSQIYVFALVFSPMKSILRQMFEMAESPNWMAVKPVMRQDWDPCLQIFEGSRISADRSRLYSPGAKWLASRSCNGIRLWDPITGECKRKWRTPSRLTAFAFSPDSVWLVTGDDKGAMRFYDVATGICHQTLASADYGDGYIRIDSMAFSSNGNTLASVELFKNHDGSQGYNYILKTWDLVIGKCLQAVALSGQRGFCDGIGMLIFSPDDTKLGSIWTNGTVIVWDASTGEHLQTLVDRDWLTCPDPCFRPKYGLYTMEYCFTKSFTELSAYFSCTQGLFHSIKEPDFTEPKMSIPLEYRPRIFAAHENYCAIATRSRSVLCFRFSD